MKKLTTILALTFVMALGISFTNCGEDTEAPVITLNGANPMDVVLNGNFNDPGATADDNEDGDITASIVVTNLPDTNSAGTYEVKYSCTDAAGNTGEMIRKVYVANQASYLAGNYAVVDSLTSTTGVYTYNDVIAASSTVNKKIMVAKFGNYVNGSVYFLINGNAITLPSQVVNCGSPAASRTFVGTGTITNGVLSIDYTESTGATSVTGVEKYTKQ